MKVNKTVFSIMLSVTFVLGFCGTTFYRAKQTIDQMKIIKVENQKLKSENNRLINEYKLMKEQRDFCFDAVDNMVEETKEEN